MAEQASESCKKLTCLLRPHSHYIDKIYTVLRSPLILIFKQQDIEFHIDQSTCDDDHKTFVLTVSVEV